MFNNVESANVDAPRTSGRADHPHEQGRVVRVQPRGDLDINTTEALKAQLADAAVHGPSIVLLDLSDVDFVDSSGLSAVIHGSQAVEAAGGALFIEGARGSVLRTLEITALLDRYRRSGDGPATPS